VVTLISIQITQLGVSLSLDILLVLLIEVLDKL
jgi:hypothetical protein